MPKLPVVPFRPVKIENQEYKLYGKPPWMKFELKHPQLGAVWIIIESAKFSNFICSSFRERYNTLARESEGKNVPVVFVGLDGEDKANKILYAINRL